MKIQDPPLHLTYGLNIHPSDSWPEVRAAVREQVTAIRARVAPDRPFGLGLRISDAASRQMQHKKVREQFKSLLRERGLYVFTINGFPYGRFHQAPVKERVYAPDWRTDRRLRYTLRLARLLADLLPDGISGSISTLPGSFRAWIRDAGDLDRITTQLAEAVAFLARLRERTGHEIHLGLEPEPGCLFERTDDLITFMREKMWRLGARRIRQRLGGSREFAEETARRHLGVCLDTCHAAVCYEAPEDALRRYQAHGIRISKIQLSAALAVSGPGIRALRAFGEPVYLHQAVAQFGNGRRWSWPDLPDALEALEKSSGIHSMRVHFHVPLHFKGTPGIRSTAFTLSPSFWSLLRRGCTGHLEIETYSFRALPGMARGNVLDSIAKEFQWVFQRLARQGPTRRVALITGSHSSPLHKRGEPGNGGRS